MDKYFGSGQDCVLGNAALTGLSGAATTFSTSAVPVSLRGKAKTFAAIAGGATPTTDANTGVAFLPQAASTGCIYLWLTDGSATIKLAQGTIVALDLQNNFTWFVSQFPAVPEGFIPFAYSVVKNSSTGTSWTIGTSNWNQAGITVSVANLMELPDRSQAS